MYRYMRFSYFLLISLWWAAGYLAAASLPPSPLNRLATEKLAVGWQSWSPASFQKAEAVNKPVFALIADSSSLASKALWDAPKLSAMLLKKIKINFVPILVDRQQMPHIEAFYERFMDRPIEARGAPIAMVLRSDKLPLEVKTVATPLILRRVLDGALATWPKRDSDSVKKQFMERLAKLQSLPEKGFQKAPGHRLGTFYARYKMERRDLKLGNYHSTVGIPSHDYLAAYRLARRNPKILRDLSLHTLLSLKLLISSGVHDHIGGGFFHRRDIDEQQLPLYEKTLVDNAMMIWVLQETYQHNQDPLIKQVMDRTITFIERELRSQAGGYYHARGAPSEDWVGRYYRVTDQNVLQALTAHQQQIFKVAFEVKKTGNLPKLLVQALEKDLPMNADQLPSSESHLRLRDGLSINVLGTNEINEVLAILQRQRYKRPAPLLERQRLAGENGLLLGSLSRAARMMGHQKAGEMAKQLARHLSTQVVGADSKMHRALTAKGVTGEALLGDYAGVIYGLSEYYQWTGETAQLQRALNLQRQVIKKFYHRDLKLFMSTPLASKDLPQPLLNLGDGVMPADTSLNLYNLARLADLAYDRGMGLIAVHTAISMGWRWQKRLPDAGFAVVATDYLDDDSWGVALIGQADQRRVWETRLFESFLPSMVVAPASLAEGPGSRPAIGLLKDQHGKPGAVTAVLCNLTKCQPPIHQRDQLLQQLKKLKPGQITLASEDKK